MYSVSFLMIISFLTHVEIYKGFVTCFVSNLYKLNNWYYYSKTCYKSPLKRRPKLVFQEQLSLNAGQKNCRVEHSTILLIFIKLPLVLNEPVHEISNNVLCATSKASDQPAHTRSLIRAFASRLSII